MAEVLLDTTFLLPTLGIEVGEITRRDLESLKSVSEGGTKLCCSYLSFVEIFGKLAKATRAQKVDDAMKEGIKSLVESDTYSWVSPSAEALKTALDLRLKGHKDNIDNILYSIALSSKMPFLSLDTTLKKFLKRNGYDESIVVGVSELSRLFPR